MLFNAVVSTTADNHSLIVDSEHHQSMTNYLSKTRGITPNDHIVKLGWRMRLVLLFVFQTVLDIGSVYRLLQWHKCNVMPFKLIYKISCNMCIYMFSYYLLYGHTLMHSSLILASPHITWRYGYSAPIPSLKLSAPRHTLLPLVRNCIPNISRYCKHNPSITFVFVTLLTGR